jgi:gas vesicle protein
MGEDPGTIRREIEQTRERMGDTVEALGYKADVPSRAKENIQGKVDSVKSKVTGMTPDTGQVADGARQAVGMAQSNPLGLAIGAAAVGFIAGMLIPETRKEHEKLGEMSDHVTGQIKSTAQEAVQHGKDAAQQVAQQTAQTAKETAQQAAQEHGSELKQTAQDNAQQAARQARESVPS